MWVNYLHIVQDKPIGFNVTKYKNSLIKLQSVHYKIVKKLHLSSSGVVSKINIHDYLKLL